ncbi:MAG: dynamin family protein [Planctomycetota bacterium]
MNRNDPLRRLERLRRRLDSELASVASLRPIEAAALDLEDLAADLDRQLERASSAAVLVLVGSTGAGKSTLLNALAGDDIAESGTTRPTTSQPTVYAPVDADLGALLAGLPIEPRVVRFEPTGGRFGDQVLVDAPDTNSVATEHRATVLALAERADVLLVVEHRQSVVERSTIEFLADFAGRRALVLVLNRSDELTEGARVELKRQLAAVAVERLGVEEAPTVHAISAALARDGAGGAVFEALLAELEDFVREGRLAGVRRNNALGVAAGIAEVASDAREQLAGALARLPDQTREGLRALIAEVQSEVDDRLRLKKAELASLLASEAGRRWDGPGGWALRSGAWSTVGAGIGLALARRNPALAAGAALGGTVVGRARQELGRRRVEDADTLLPEPDRLATLHSEHIGPARVAAGVASTTPEDLGVPTLEQVERELQRAVADAWSRLMNRTLPETAERSAPALLRWALDLPVYALAGWVLLRAAQGFTSGQYVGLDFVINGALLALALAFVVRMAIRSVLSARAGGLLRRVSGDVGQALESAATRSVVPLGETCQQLDDHLDRLCRLETVWRRELESKRARG